MSRHFLFAGKDCYPNGGMRDYQGDFDSLEEAQAFLLTEDAWTSKHTGEAGILRHELLDWGHIYSIERDRIVAVWEWVRPEHSNWKDAQNSRGALQWHQLGAGERLHFAFA